MVSPEHPPIRVTIPIRRFNLKPAPDAPDADQHIGDRIDLGAGAVLARLNEAETARLSGVSVEDLASGEFESNHCRWRFELFGVPPAAGADAARLLFQQLALVVRELPDPRSIMFDLQVAGIWRRRGMPTVGGLRASAPYGWVSFPVSRLDTVRRIRSNSTDLIGGDGYLSIRRALDHYEESVRALGRQDHDTALVLAALAHESLLGAGLNLDLSYRLRVRGALLTASPGVSREIVLRRLGQLYSARSKVVHNAGHASRHDATHYQQFLMRAVPSFIELANRVGGPKRAVAALDEAVLGSDGVDTNVAEVATGGDGLWWSYVDLPKCFAQPAPPVVLTERFVWFDY